MAWSALTPYTSGQVPTAAQFAQAQANFSSLRLFNDHGVKLYLDANQTIPTATDTALSWGLVVGTQVGTIWALSPNPDRLVAPVTGKYLAILNVEWLDDTTGERAMGLTRASDGRLFRLQGNGAAQGGGNQSGIALIQLTAGDYLQAIVRHTKGSNLDVHGGTEDRTSVCMALAGV